MVFKFECEKYSFEFTSCSVRGAKSFASRHYWNSKSCPRSNFFL